MCGHFYVTDNMKKIRKCQKNLLQNEIPQIVLPNVSQLHGLHTITELFLQFLNTAQYFWDFTFSIVSDVLALGFAETFAEVILLCVLLPLQVAPCS
jgi:hypothetical protein